jgi:DNA-binding transcriptional regulator YiaG
MQYASDPMPRTKYDALTFPEGPFSKAVRKLRDVTGLSQEAAARELRVTLSTVSKWERDEVTPQPMVQEAVVAKLRALAPHPKRKRPAT